MQIKRATQEDFFKQWPDYWPSKKNFVSEHRVSRAQYDDFYDLLAKRSSETAIERFLATNREVLVSIMSYFSTGHHAAWVYPKQYIRPPSDSPGGLIPDYILAGASSDGVDWFLVELKGANHKAFTKQGKRVFLSPEANKGICQLLNYIDFAAKSQSYLRDELGLLGFREPRGVLVIGTEDETEDADKRAFKAAWNRINPRITIRSYNAMLRQVESKLHAFKRC